MGCGLLNADLANPTALVGLAAVNGAAKTAMRSDGAPALDQGITPKWTLPHKFDKRILIGGDEYHPVSEFFTPRGPTYRYAYKPGDPVLTSVVSSINKTLGYTAGCSMRGLVGGTMTPSSNRIIIEASSPIGPTTFTIFDSGSIPLSGDYVLEFDLALVVGAVDLRAMTRVYGLIGPIVPVTHSYFVGWNPAGQDVNSQISIITSAAAGGTAQVLWAEIDYAWNPPAVA